MSAQTSRWIIEGNRGYLTIGNKWTADIAKAARFSPEMALIHAVREGACALSVLSTSARRVRKAA